jgi:hypothetical protein
MSKFEKALDNAFEKRKKELGRAPTVFTEMETLREQLFQEWLLAERFDDLISYIHWYHLDEGGIGDCSSLSEALRKKGDLQRIERLFNKLIQVRTTQFWHWWPKARQGHIGAMRTCAKFATWATEAYAGLWHGYWSLGNEEGQERIRLEMLQFQGRIKPQKPGRRSSK